MLKHCITGFADASFFASLEANGGVGEPIIFTNEIINPGGHYNSATGEYTVPHNGTYMFSVHLQTIVSTDVIGKKPVQENPSQDINSILSNVMNLCLIII